MDLRAVITAHLDERATEGDALSVEHRIEGYRAALDNPTADLLAIATELELIP